VTLAFENVDATQGIPPEMGDVPASPDFLIRMVAQAVDAIQTITFAFAQVAREGEGATQEEILEEAKQIWQGYCRAEG
jgi:hypothetical protein